MGAVNFCFVLSLNCFPYYIFGSYSSHSPNFPQILSYLPTHLTSCSFSFKKKQRAKQNKTKSRHTNNNNNNKQNPWSQLCGGQLLLSTRPVPELLFLSASPMLSVATKYHFHFLNCIPIYCLLFLKLKCSNLSIFY